MSSISFRNKHQTVKVSGRERAWFRCLIDNISLGLLGPILEDRENWDRVKDALAPGCSWVDPHDWQYFRTRLLTAFRTGNGLWHGEPLDSFILRLNTALALGGDALRLAAKIHGQCEIHGFFRAENGPWAARIIRQGLKTYIFRRDKAQYDGWEAVADLLEHTKGTVIMDYSVTDGFPEGILTEEERESENWPSWEACLYRLMNNYPDREICPETWDSLFDHELTLLDLIKEWNGD